MKHRIKFAAAALAASGVAAMASPAFAVSYASGVTRTGTTVNFTLNSPADILSYSINGGAPITLDGTTKGAKTFNLTNANDTFSIIAERTDATGYTMETGNIITRASSDHGLTVDSDEGGLTLLSDNANALARFNSPRGVSVSNNPNAPNFGTTYVVNTLAGSLVASGAFPARTVGDGIYGLRADGSDAYGYGDTAQNPIIAGLPAWEGPSQSSGWRNFVAADGTVYVTDYSDSSGSLISLPPNMSTATNVLADFGGLTALPAGRNHGSLTSVHVEGSAAAGNLTVYTIDEDLTTNHVTGAGSTTDRNSLWRYDIGNGTIPSTLMPTKMASVLLSGANSDMQRGADGKWYLSQYRAFSNNSATLFVLSPDGSTVLFNSLTASRTLTGDPALALDILQSAQSMAVSPDQKWVALMLNNSDVAVVPLVDGIPDIANRKVINTAEPNINSGRDIAFDAAGNIHYVSSGQGALRVIAPGGHSIATTTWNGTEFVFDVTSGGGPGGLDGDFNGDLIVDGNDFLLWQTGGSPNPGSQADLTLWKNNFGQTAAAPAAAAVPEPTSFAMAGLAVAALAAVRRRNRS